MRSRRRVPEFKLMQTFNQSPVVSLWLKPHVVSWASTLAGILLSKPRVLLLYLFLFFQTFNTISHLLRSFVLFSPLSFFFYLIVFCFLRVQLCSVFGVWGGAENRCMLATAGSSVTLKNPSCKKKEGKKKFYVVYVFESNNCILSYQMYASES